MHKMVNVELFPHFMLES